MRALSMLLAVLLAWGGAARGQTPPPEKRKARSIAVLEFRAGAAGAGSIGQRTAAILRKRTSSPITDPDDARRTAPKIDDQVARCSGQPACVGELGRRLGVDEVILVGVSELGDLILAFQRVEAKTGTVLGRVADSLPRNAEIDEAALESYLRRLLPREDFLRWGTLLIATDLAGAEVKLGGETKGQTPVEPIPVPAPQTIDLRVSKKGYTDFSARIDVIPDSTVEVRPVLQRKSGSAWYERPWVWAIAGVVVAGGVATAVVLTRPSSDAVPVDVTF